MPDREKVIKGLEICKERNYCCPECPYYDRDAEMGCHSNELMADSLALLKEQEAVSVEVCGHMFTVKYGHCPKCNEGLDSEAYPHWCGYCGQAVKWE